MNISSRTPEGSPQHCPVCGEEVCLEPSPDSFDAPCPHCGQLLWFADVVVSVFSFPERAAESNDQVDAFIEEVSQVIEMSPRPRVLIDLSTVDQLESRTLPMLHDLVERCGAKNGIVVLCAGQRLKAESYPSLLHEGDLPVVQSRDEARKLFWRYDQGHQEHSAKDADFSPEIYQKLLEGSDEEASRLWKKSTFQLLSSALKSLEGEPKSKKAQKLAVIAFAELIKSVSGGHFSDLKDQNDLWCVLFDMTQQKGNNWNNNEARLHTNGKSSHNTIPDDFVEDRTIRLLAECAKESLELLEPKLREYALARLAGFTKQEIAQELGVTVRSVERKLQLIRQIWTDNSGDSTV